MRYYGGTEKDYWRPLWRRRLSGERRGSTEAQDVYGKHILVTRDGLTYGEEFVPFDEIVGTRPASHALWNPATNLFEVRVVWRSGPDLVLRTCPRRPQTCSGKR